MTRVLVVGAGPVGLVAALRLAGAGIPVAVLEAEDGVSRELRASTFHPPTLDLLATLDGVVPALLQRGLVCSSWQVRLHGTGERAEFDLSALAGETDHPYRLQCPQRELSLILLDMLTRHGVTVHFGWQVAAVRQNGDVVTVTAQDGSARRAPFVVGADGARSAVRASLGVDFPGLTYPETTILATTAFPFEEHLPGLSRVNYVWTDEGTYSLLRLPDQWRCSLYPADGQSIAEAVTPAAIQRKLRAIVPVADTFPVGEVRPYRVHQRLAGTFRVGRVALAGDAAHLSSPSGGMGMNGGIHDAFELTETLAEIWHRGAPLDLLDRYTRRRRTVIAEEVIAQADANRARMQERDPSARRRTLAALQAIATDPARLRQHLLRTSMISGWRRSREIA